MGVVSCLIIILLVVYIYDRLWKQESYYATLSNYNPSANDTLFLSPSRYCQGGPYMTTGNPAKAALCSQLAQNGQLSGCSPGFNGAPIGFSYYDSNAFANGI